LKVIICKINGHISIYNPFNLFLSSGWNKTLLLSPFPDAPIILTKRKHEVRKEDEEEIRKVDET
jgi:hypothetical protein